MKVVVGGASGFLGSALIQRLEARGDDVVRLVRRGASSTHESLWDPHRGVIDQAVIDAADAVVNLSGQPVAHWPPTTAWKRELVASRLTATTTLAAAVAAAPNPPILLSGSGAGYYGPDRGDEILTEDSAPGSGFLAQLVADWEQATAPASDAGARVVFLRTGLVAHPSGGVLKSMLPVARLGLSATIGRGTQYFPVISRTDWCRAVTHALTTGIAGPINLAMPDVPTNAEFTRALGRVFGKPTLLRVPATVLKLALGEMSADLLGSVRLRPQRLLDSGFEFEQPTVADVLAAVL